MRVLIIHNPRSGFGSDAVFAFERELVRAGDECLLRVLPDDFTPESAVKDAENFDVVVLSGGDGSVSGMLYALRGKDCSVCIFPSGTANLLFDNIGNSPEPAALARACRWGETALCDVGEIEWDSDGEHHKRGFSLMSGAGFDAELMRAATPNKRAFGELAYFLAVLHDPNPRVLHYVIEADGTTIERDGIACLVANNSMIQGEIEIVPGGRMDDGLIDIIVLEAKATVQLVRPALAGLFDRTGEAGLRPYLEFFHCKEARVSASEAIPMQVDGDVVSSAVQTWTARALPKANKLIVDRLSRYQPEQKRETPLYDVPKELPSPEAAN